MGCIDALGLPLPTSPACGGGASPSPRAGRVGEGRDRSPGTDATFLSPRDDVDLLFDVSRHTCKEEEHQADAAGAAALARQVARLEPLICVKG